MNENIINMIREEYELKNKIISQIEKWGNQDYIEKAYNNGYLDGGKIRNVMIANLLEQIIIRNKDPLDLCLELKELIEDLKNED